MNTTADALLTAGTVAVGQTREVVVTENLTRTQIVQYAGASGDFNPLHTDEPYAVQVAGYDTVLAHGLLTMGMAGTAVTDWVGAGRLVRYGVRFKSPVFPGDALTTRLAVTEVQAGADSVLVTLSVDTVNGKGEAVVTGHAEARLPR